MPRKKYFVSYVHHGEHGASGVAQAQFGNTIAVVAQPICTSEQVRDITDQIRKERKVSGVTILNFVDLF